MTEKMIVYEDPKTGEIYEIPASVLAQYRASRERVLKIMAERANGSSAPAAPAAPAEPAGAAAPGEQNITLPAGPQPIVLNIYLGGGQVQVTQKPSGVAGYHMAFDENGIPHLHHEWLWGDYIDKQGKPQVGYHSHDPATGNASG
jgi:hypothetical protein